MKIVENGAPDRDEEAALWCLELADGDLSPDRRRELDRWMMNADNHEAFQRAAEVWDVTEAIATMPEVVHMRAEALDSYRAASARRWRKPAGIKWPGWSAIGAVAAAAALLLWLAIPNSDAYRTGVGETKVAMLKDGSRLSLDADSDVEASFDSKRRALVLNKGRARFDVAHNPLQPFTVTVGDKVVVATGTSFSVERLGDEARIILYEGHVAVLDQYGQPSGGRKPRVLEDMLKPGNEMTLPALGKGPVVVGAVDLDASSRQDQVSFDDDPLSLAVERMNRYLAKPLVADAKAAQVRVTGVFDNSDATGFLEAVRQLDGVQAQEQQGKILLTRP